MTKSNFDKNVKLLTKFVCDKGAYNTQDNYLKDTKKPEDMTMLQWPKRIKAINKMLPHLKPNSLKTTIANMNKYVI
eukprot:5204522-Ditylum_brightwellii.AAC.1